MLKFKIDVLTKKVMNKANKYIVYFVLLWKGRRRFVRAMLEFIAIYLAYRRAAHAIKSKQAHNQAAIDIYRTTHTANAERLFRLFQTNGGTWIKAGQFLSARPDILPIEYIEALLPLQNDVKPLPFSQIEPVLQQHLGPDWKSRFTEFSENPIASASFGQVYKARLLDGRQVAIKVMIPGVESLCEQDFILYRLLAKLLSMKLRQVDFVAAVEIFLKTLKGELDFKQEANNIASFHNLKHIKGIRTPILVPELSNEKLVTTEWIDGYRLVDFLRGSDRGAQVELLTRLQTSFMQQIIRFGIFQGDPHPGNFLVDEDLNIAIVDFGYMGILSEKERLNYVNILLSVLDGNARSFKAALVDGGFVGLSDDMFSDKLIDLIIALSTKKITDIRYEDVDVLFKEVIGSIQQHRVKVPEHYLVTGRVLLTITGLFKLFNVPPDRVDIKQMLFSC